MAEEKSITPFDFINDCSFSKKYLYSEETKSKYNAYIINVGFSNFNDTVLYANEMNRMHYLSDKMQHDFYFYSLSQRKRWSKWSKKDKQQEDILYISKYFNINTTRAIEYYNTLIASKQQDKIEEIRIKIKTLEKY